MREETRMDDSTETPLCDAIPLSHLALDVSEPLVGWEAFFQARNVQVFDDAIGRPSIAQNVLGGLIAEHREREARLMAKKAAAREAAARKPARIGVPALEGATPFESLTAADGYTTPDREFGGGRVSPRQEFLDQMLGEGKRHLVQERAKAEALKKAQRILDGRPEE
jgi:hypothetical protein